MRVIGFFTAMVAVMFFVPSLAYAVDAVADDSGMMAAIISALPDLVDTLPAWVGVSVGVLYGGAHLVASLPTAVTESWPSWLKTAINFLAANYGGAKNKDG